MGTDIHAFIEYDATPDNLIPFRPASNGSMQITPFACGEIRVLRDYDLFDALAYGRSGRVRDGREDGKRPLIFPRGIPPGVTQAISQRYYHVVEDPEYSTDRYDPRNRWIGTLPPVAREKALEWVAQGFAQWAPTERNARGELAWDRISNPNWHTASWLNLQEILMALEHFGIDVTRTSFEFQLVLQVMNLLETKYGPGRTRMVFWFDN
jgi:hypothetical protein